MIPRPHSVLVGRTLRLAPFAAEDISTAYLAWLSDPEVNRYSRRVNQGPVSRTDAKDYLAGLAQDEIVLAIFHAEHGHVGNIKYGPVDWTDKSADISILIGETKCWGQGIGSEAIFIVSRYLFGELGLIRVDAGTCNPAFIRMVEKLGWRIEDVKPAHIRIGKQWMDYTFLAQDRREFREHAAKILPPAASQSTRQVAGS
jgi:ribosomal-protein-alanine N-acetyltransferase